MHKIADWVKGHPRTSAVGSVALAAFILIAIWYRGKSFDSVQTTSLDNFEKVLDIAIIKNANDLTNWYRANIVIQSIVIVTGLLATISAAATTKDNAASLKAYTVVLTGITSTLAIVMNTFHIRENIETFIRANSDLANLETEYISQRNKIDGLNDILLKKKKDDLAEIQKGAESSLSKLDPPIISELKVKYEQRYLVIEAARLHAWASVGQQSLPASNSEQPATQINNQDKTDKQSAAGEVTK